MTSTEAMMAKLLGEVFVGKIRIGHRSSEPYFLTGVRHVMLQIKKSVGDEGFEQLATATTPALHALADLVFDRLTDVSGRQLTMSKLRALHVPQRLWVENVANALTGINVMTGYEDKGRGRWMDELWDIRKRLHLMSELSVTGISLAEIRESFDGFVHELVDWLVENRKMFVS